MLVQVFEAVTKAEGDRPAIIDGKGRTVSFNGLQTLSEGYAAGFRARGIGKGDRVLIAMPVGIDLFAALAAIWRLGATVVFPEPQLGLAGLRHAARITKPKAFLSSGWYRLLGFLVPDLLFLPMRLTPIAKTGATVSDHSEEADTALISFTSGSTGNPKAIARSHSFMMAQAASVKPLLSGAEADDRDLVAFPVFVLACLSLGITSVLPAWPLKRPDKADAETLTTQIARDRVTRLLIPPVICETLARTALPFSLRAIFTGGGPVFPDVMAALSKKIPGVRLVAVYGSTEAEPIAHLDFHDTGPDDFTAMRNGAGLLAGDTVPDIEIAIVDGEIQVAGAHVNETYLNPDDAIENKVLRDGRIWHRTGDAGRLDETGRVWLEGRWSKNGTALSPLRIETAARYWPGLRKSALAEISGKMVLAVEGDERSLKAWHKRATSLGVADVRPVKEIPMDRRHRSKVDMARLRKLLG
ncbi:MAG: AMP-binding protein [Pseudomonadota bacterium]